MKPVDFFWSWPALLRSLPALLLLVGCVGPPADPVVERETWTLPAQMGPLTLSGAPVSCNLEDLFVHINGGAQLYQEYGFRHYWSGTYGQPGAAALALEIFEMTDAFAAQGIYTYKRGETGGKGLALGRAGWQEDYFLNAWQGRFLVTVTTRGTTAPPGERLAELGRLALAVLPTRAPVKPLPPALFTLSSARPGTLVRFVGYAGMVRSLGPELRGLPLPQRGESAEIPRGEGYIRCAVLEYSTARAGVAAADFFRNLSPGVGHARLRGKRLYLVFDPATAKDLADFMREE